MTWAPCAMAHDGREGGLDARGVGDRAVLQRHVEVGADEDARAGELETIDVA